MMNIGDEINLSLIKPFERSGSTLGAFSSFWIATLTCPQVRRAIIHVLCTITN
jgi:hypothetical protein